MGCKVLASTENIPYAEGYGPLGGSMHFIVPAHLFPIRTFLYGSAKPVHDLEQRGSENFQCQTMNF